MTKFKELVENILKENKPIIYRTYADQPYLNDIKGSFYNKPKGCLWGCRDDSWKNWCNEEEFRCSDNYFEWTLKPGTKIFTIDSIKDFLYLLKHYSEYVENYRNEKDYYIDFLKISKDYDAVELTQNGNNQLHYKLILDNNSEFNDDKYKAALEMALNIWDVPSICVFYPSKTIDIIEKPVKENTVKQGNSWTNKGKEGTHGTFKTKKQADAQRKAMFANGYKG